MGTCSSVICANGEIEKVENFEKTETSETTEGLEKTTTIEETRRSKKTGRSKKTKRIKKREKTGRNEKNDDIEETPVIEIHIRCPSSSWQSQSELKQAAAAAGAAASGTTAKVCSSLELIDIEDGDEPLMEQQEFRPGNKSDVAHAQVDGLRKIRELAEQNDTRPGSCTEARQQPDGNDREYSLPGSSGLHRRTKFSAPPPRPSQWHQVYTKKLKHKEKRAEESLKKEPKKKPKKRITREEQDHAYRISLIKKIKKSIMKNAKSQGSNVAPVPIAIDEYFSRIFGVDVEDIKAGSSSSSSESSRSSSAASQRSSDGDIDELSIGRFYKAGDSDNVQKRARKTRGWFGWKHNKVVPL